MRIGCGLYGIATLLWIVGSAGAARADPPTGMAGRLVRHYHMQRVAQEGCWFALSYASDDKIDGGALPARYAERPHAAGSAILAVVTPRDFSALHRLQTDEVWHFYGGTPLTLLLLYPDGTGRTVTLGNDVFAGELPQFTVPHGVWQGSRPRSSAPGSYAFVGTQLSPGFDYADFEIGYRDDLQHRYPAFASDISRLTRSEFSVAPPRSTAAVTASPAIAWPSRETPEVAVSPGVSLQELVGRVAEKARTSRVSVAKFTLAPGGSSGMSFNHQALEVFLVTDGSGVVHLGDHSAAVSSGSTVFIPAEAVHSIEAGNRASLTFFAISAPAFSPEDYVRVAP
jgi:hypothetical protein